MVPSPLVGGCGNGGDTLSPDARPAAPLQANFSLSAACRCRRGAKSGAGRDVCRRPTVGRLRSRGRGEPTRSGRGFSPSKCGRWHRSAALNFTRSRATATSLRRHGETRHKLRPHGVRAELGPADPGEGETHMALHMTLGGTCRVSSSNLRRRLRHSRATTPRSGSVPAVHDRRNRLSDLFGGALNVSVTEVGVAQRHAYVGLSPSSASPPPPGSLPRATGSSGGPPSCARRTCPWWSTTRDS